MTGLSTAAAALNKSFNSHLRSNRYNAAIDAGYCEVLQSRPLTPIGPESYVRAHVRCFGTRWSGLALASAPQKRCLTQMPPARGARMYSRQLIVIAPEAILMCDVR